VAKILVADDNSNIQKMVGLALRDHGIDVVAVGNGEAAVRKISDVHPDLVLADVFMPVRNGYEVCKYVKDDKALSHIPVILLVGAFDPLDEQEAQRAGADGVLKKPFVPPDPLISMVKSALVRAGVAHAGFTPAKVEPEAAPVRVAAPVQEVAAAPRVAPPPPPPVEAPPPMVPEETESFVDEVPARPAAFSIESRDQLVAFGSLLETPSAATDEEAPELAAAPPGLRMEHDWRSAKNEDEDGGEEEPRSPSWRRDGAEEEESFVDHGSSAAGSDFRGGGQESWTPTREKADLTNSVEPVESIPAGIMDRRDMPATAPFSGEAWAKAIDAGLDHKTAVAEEEQPAAHRDLEQMIGHAAESLVTESMPAVTLPEVPEDAEPVGMAAEHAAAIVEEGPASLAEESSAAVVEEPPTVLAAPKVSTADSWFSTPPNPWEAEAQKASQLASAWDTVATAPVVTESIRGDVSFGVTSAPDEIEVVSGANSEIAAAAAETVREEASQAVEQAGQQMDASPATTSAKEAVHDATANLDMDAVVAKVLARINPGLLHEATREILKPVVEAVIREELHAKKS
jgi:CheY-like chemotaxis protein